MSDRKLQGAVVALLLAVLLTCPAAWTQVRELNSPTSNLFSAPYSNFNIRASDHALFDLAPPTGQVGPIGEPQPEGGLIGRAARRFGEDQKEIYTSPFRRHNLKWDALFLGGTAALVAADESASRLLPTSSAYISRDISNATLITTSAFVGGTWIYGLKTGNEHAKETGELTLETLANTFTVYAATQVIAGRQRPYEGTGEGSFFKNHSVNTAFPGGHAMFTFAMAGIVAHEYPHPLVQILAYGAASAVAASRFTARQHFLSDVAVGSALGYLISREIFYSRCKLGLNSACHRRGKE